MSRDELIVVVLVAWRSQSCTEALAGAGAASGAAGARGRRVNFIHSTLIDSVDGIRRCSEPDVDAVPPVDDEVEALAGVLRIAVALDRCGDGDGVARAGDGEGAAQEAAGDGEAVVLLQERGPLAVAGGNEQMQ